MVFNMNNMSNKLMDRFFRRVDGVVWDLMSGRVGVKNADGIVTIEGVGDDAQVVINMFDQFGMELPAFAQSTPIAAVTVGDLIYGAKAPLGWVVEKTDKSFKLLKADGTRTVWSPPKVQMLGFDGGVMVLRSLVNMLPGGTNGLGQMQGMLLPMLAMGGDGLDLDSMMPLLLMTQMGGMPGVTGDPNAPAMQPNMFANMMPMMLMMSMMKGGKGGKGGGNFFDN
jgi:hypothetical protein